MMRMIVLWQNKKDLRTAILDLNDPEKRRLFRRKEMKYFAVYVSFVMVVLLKQMSRSMNWVSLNFSFVGFLIIECSILGMLIYSFRLFTQTLKLYHLERYQKVIKEMNRFMIVWLIPLFFSIIIRFILMLESTGISHFGNETRNIVRTLQTINLGFLYVF